MKRFIVNLILILSFAFALNAQEVFINEINYLNEERPFVEIVAPSTINVDDYTLHFYDGVGNIYHTQSIEIGESSNAPETNSSPSDECISRFVIIDVVIMLGEDKSGIALTDPYNSLVQFVSYGGTNVGQEGPAKNVVSENIGKQTDPNASLQLTGLGNSYDDFTWDTPGTTTTGDANTDQDVSCDETGDDKFNLPVEWISFTAEAEQKGIALAWQTASEEDNNSFILEHSRDGFAFTAITEIRAKGNTISGGTYEYFHAKPMVGSNYYRIAQIDGSGQKNYFRLLTVQFRSDDHTYELFPNPVVDAFSIVLPDIEQEEIQIDFVNTSGQVVKSITSQAVDNWITLYADGLTKGYYQVIVRTTSTVQHLPLIVQ